jgi:thiol-disulfide isomerase/thioredoxin
MRGLCIFFGLFILYLHSSTAQESAAQTPAVYRVDAPALHKKILKSRGKVVVVNVWATWCVPCIEEFPDLLRLRTTFEAQGLEMIFVSADSPKRLRQDVYPFLKKMKVTFPTYIKETQDDEGFINALSREWRGALPATFIYDRKGKLIHTLLDAQSFKDLSSLVEPLLARAP